MKISNMKAGNLTKNILYAALFCTLFMAAGCGDNNEQARQNQAYLSEGNGEEDAVNTSMAGSKYKITGPMDDLKDAVVGILGDNYWPDTMLTAEELAERTGISENMYEDYLAEYQHTQAGIDMMILIKAREEEVENVENYLSQYREILLRIYEQQPHNESKVFASRIEVIDNYVCYVQLGADITSLNEQDSEKMVAHCQHENERALDIIEKKIFNA